MALKAIIFDVDGTLADTERTGHLAACNAAFSQMGLNIHWSWEVYREMMPIQGNVNRLKFTLNKSKELSETEIDAIAIQFGKLKQQLYNKEFVHQTTLRPGVVHLLNELKLSDLAVCIVSSSYESQIKTILDARLIDFKDLFQFILGKESGVKTGKEGILYRKALTRLKMDANTVVTIEDSNVGHEAARQEGISTVITYNDYTKDEDFTNALMVVPGLDYIDLTTIRKAHRNKFTPQLIN